MPIFEFLPHTGDAKFRAYGKNLEEQFSNAALAVSSIMIDYQKIKPVLTKKISLSASDDKALLFAWLEEFIYLADAEFFFIHEIQNLKIKKNEKFELNAVVKGDKWKEEYGTRTGVKAATYNEMEITSEYVQVVVDI